ncbi:thioredoxin family protein [Gammaproteobacteria bacterium]|nr:thioredoxin family protein [Gammaproteobacteria bacterium]MDC1110802.1 thioredoxin family protein [Gammaproteobacteria bacterium]
MNIILDTNECPAVPHPEPYLGLIASILDIQEFIQRTIKSNKQPIVIFGANWCPDARLLEGVIQLPTVKNFLEKNANILNIDVGNYEMNTELFSFFDKNIEEGIPRVFIMDRKGKTLNMHVNDTMRKAQDLTTQDIFNYLQEFVIET